MDRNEKNGNSNNSEYYVVDVMNILRSLWSRAWIILLVSILAGAATLVFTMFFVTPKYASSVMLYVNNSESEENKDSLSQTDLNAAQSLVKTYEVILDTDTTWQEVIQHTGVNRTCKDLSKMVSTAAVNDTEVFRVTVVSEDPAEAGIIAQGIADVLPHRIEDVIDGSSMRLVDGVGDTAEKVSPNITQNTVLGALVGFLGACLLFVIMAMLDDTIRNEDYIVQNYDLPILAKIPDLSEEESSGRKYSYYYKSREYRQNHTAGEKEEG